MKLGLILRNTSGGDAEVHSCNKDASWGNAIIDVRSAITTLNHFDGTSKFAYFIKFLGKDGYLFCIIKACPEGSGRSGDNSAAWIHCPARIDIYADEMVDVVDRVKRVMSNAEGTDTKELDQIFSQEYREKETKWTAISMIRSDLSRSYAYRYYSNEDYTLKELLGDRLAQLEYAKYKGIFLLDKEDGITSQGEELDFEPKDICTCKPLSNTKEFRPKIKGAPFDVTKEGFELPLGVPITITWEQEGYKPIEKIFTAREGADWKQEVSIEGEVYHVLIRRDMFDVRDNWDAPILKVSIQVKDKYLESTLEFSEQELKNGLSIRFEEMNYDPLDIKYNEMDFIYFIKHKQRKNVSMKDKKYEIKTLFDLNGKAIEANISFRTSERINENNIKLQYESKNKYNESKERFWEKLQYIGIGFMLAIAICLVFNMVSGWTEQDKPDHHPQENQNTTTQPDSASSSAQSLPIIPPCLEDTTWHKDKLAHDHKTEKIFDWMNSFELDSLQKALEPFSKNSQCDTLLQAIKEVINKPDYKRNLQKGKEQSLFNGKYNASNDYKININNYIKYIKENSSPKKPTQNSSTQQKSGKQTAETHNAENGEDI